uniref:NADH dehydrogenase subunit 6 n=1 Tax=Nesophrosyne sp. 246 GMB-2012 TaxID=1223957 RepID=UPI0021822338|nr:NADH dehydrogenase subunit 6 [Nesophrosyne sp. 246 GMB-2012]UVI59857.1 NADH dehydrogenase subunit 6 [Nesophrosyne sp. 246 GMB-2012]
MKILLMKLMIAISSYTLALNTPMSMGIMLLILTCTSTILMAQVLTTAWIPMIMFLMFVGGLLILFMYMSSIASNEKFKTNILLAITPLIFTLLVPMENLMIETLMDENLLSTVSTDSISMTKIYNKKTFIITIFMFLYLLMSMIVVTKIIKIFKGPLRSK